MHGLSTVNFGAVLLQTEQSAERLADVGQGAGWCLGFNTALLTVVLRGVPD